jgi:adenylylsulfate reductase subunit A
MQAMIIACGGVVNVFRRSVGEEPGRAWYPVWNAGSMPCPRNRRQDGADGKPFRPARFKDGYSPVSAWFLFFQAQATLCATAKTMAKREGQERVPGTPCPGTCLGPCGHDGNAGPQPS